MPAVLSIFFIFPCACSCLFICCSLLLLHISTFIEEGRGDITCRRNDQIKKHTSHLFNFSASQKALWSQRDDIPVSHWPLSYLYGAELLVICAGQAEAALLSMASRAAWAQAVRRRGHGGGPGARLVHYGDLHAVCLKGLLVHKLVILEKEKKLDSVLLMNHSITSMIGSAQWWVKMFHSKA